MAFDLNNAVQQGLNRDVTTNDWHVEARNLEIKLDDHGGVREFRILDNENVGVVVADSDGYLSIAGNSEVHGGNILIRGESLTNTGYITLQDETDEVSVHLFNVNPDGSVSGDLGSFGTNYNDGYMYVNTNGGTQWERLAMVSQIPNLGQASVTLQTAYDNDADGSDAIITTNATDGAFVVAGDQKFQVTATSGIDLDSQFDMDSTGDFDVLLTGAGAFSLDSSAASNISVASANLTLETTTSGDVQVNVPDGGGDFIVDDAGGSRYVRAITSNGELQLGDSATPVFVTVMSDLEVLGDFIVQGTTTTLNTQELFIEDRLIRLNTGSPSNFVGNVGLEAEVGSDGYVEFHWDDTQGRWELSIDRSLVPESQTFRPLPYLADAPATLDLSDIGEDGWPTAGPNPSAGASVINTNSTNFPYTFGPSMLDDSVQAALEAIDGYFIDITTDLVGHNELTNNPHSVTFTQAVTADSLTDILASEAETLTNGSNADALHTHAAATATTTLQQAYKNDPDSVAAIIHTDTADGYVEIAGDQKLMVTATGGFDLDTGFDMDGAGPFDVDITGAASIDADAASNVTVDGANLTLSTTTSGNVIVSSVDVLDLDGTDVLVDASNNLDMRAANAFSLDGYADSVISVTGGELTLSTLTTGSVHVDGVDGISLDGNGNNVIPTDSCTDSLGDPSHGWTTIYLCKNGVPISLGAPGTSSELSNITSGAVLIGTNPLNFEAFGPDMTDDTVQAALEAIDGYFSTLNLSNLDTPFQQVRGLDINGAVLNGVVKISTDAATPALDFKKASTSRASWSLPVPADWDGLSDIVVEVIWSPATTNTGNVEWRLEYKSLALTELSSSAASTGDYTQAGGGIADGIQSTEGNLIIPGAAVDIADDLIVINIVRRGSAAGDTFTDFAQVHLVKYRYTANNIV